MNTPLRRIWRGAVLLAIVFVSGIGGYRYFGGYDWVGAIWMVVVTISTVGYGEQSSLTPAMQLFTAAFIVIGISVSAYTFGGLLQLILEGELDRVLGVRRMTRELNRIRNHIVVCGYGRMGKRLTTDLIAQGRTVVVIENDVEVARQTTADGITCVHGDATQESVLQSASIQYAHTLVAALPNDAESVFITLTARNLNQDLRIIARAEQESTEKKLLQAGANRVVLPTVVGAGQMARMITKPTTAELMDLVSLSSFVDLELDEIEVPAGNRLIGMSVRDSSAHSRHRLLFVAIKGRDGKLIFNPGGDHRFSECEVVMLIGHREDIARFRAEFGLA